MRADLVASAAARAAPDRGDLCGYAYGRWADRGPTLPCERPLILCLAAVGGAREGRRVNPAVRGGVGWLGGELGPGVFRPLIEAGRIRIQNGRSTAVAQGCRPRWFKRWISASS